MARLVEPTLGYYLPLALVLLVGEALNVLKQHLSVALVLRLYLPRYGGVVGINSDWRRDQRMLELPRSSAPKSQLGIVPARVNTPSPVFHDCLLADGRERRRLAGGEAVLRTETRRSCRVALLQALPVGRLRATQCGQSAERT